MPWKRIFRRTEVPDELWSSELNLLRTTASRKRSSCRQSRGKAIEEDASRDLFEEEQDLEILTTRFVHDWRIKTRRFKNGKEQKLWLRRGRLVAREFANAKRHDVRLLQAPMYFDYYQ